MDSEDMDRTVSSIPFVYDQLKGLGVSANVWDDVLDELFDERGLFRRVPPTYRERLEGGRASSLQYRRVSP